MHLKINAKLQNKNGLTKLSAHFYHFLYVWCAFWSSFRLFVRKNTVFHLQFHERLYMVVHTHIGLVVTTFAQSAVEGDGGSHAYIERQFFRCLKVCKDSEALCQFADFRLSGQVFPVGAQVRSLGDT